MKSRIFRILIYCSFVFLFLAAVMVRINTVNNERNAKMNNFFSFNEELGKPVEVVKVKKGKMIVGRKLSVVDSGNRFLTAFVSGAEKQVLKKGQKVKSLSSKSIFDGEITSVSKNVDLSTGMYKIGIRKYKSNHIDKSRVVIPVIAETKKYSKVISVPKSAVLKDEHGQFVWKVKGNNALLQRVKTSESNLDVLQVTSGVNSGDLIITNGFRGLVNNQKIMIVKKVERE